MLNTKEKNRVDNLIELLPKNFNSLLEVGVRDGYITNFIRPYYNTIFGIDIVKPQKNECKNMVVNDVARMGFREKAFDVVLCSEVLEHVPTKKLQYACQELQRVAKKFIVIGVPYKQDIRVGRTTCKSCGKHNPPYGHINKFDEEYLKKLFRTAAIVKIQYVGENRRKTNSISCFLRDLVSNPFGTYNQEEPCIFCGSKLIPPKPSIIRKAINKLAALVDKVQSFFLQKKANWIHILIEILD